MLLFQHKRDIKVFMRYFPFLFSSKSLNPVYILPHSTLPLFDGSVFPYG